MVDPAAIQDGVADPLTGVPWGTGPIGAGDLSGGICASPRGHHLARIRYFVKAGVDALDPHPITINWDPAGPW